MRKETKVLDRRVIPADTLIIEAGMAANQAFFIEKGRVEVFIIDKNGKKMILNELGPGSLVGEMALMSGDPRSANVRTLESCTFIVITAHDLEEKLKNSKDMYKTLIKMMTDRMKETNEKLLKKEEELSAFEEMSKEQLENITEHMSKKQEQIDKEIVPVLDEIKATFEKMHAEKKEQEKK